MKAILEFDRYDDEDELHAAVHALDYKCAVDDFDTVMRKLYNKGPEWYGMPEGDLISFAWLWDRWRAATSDLA